MTLPDNVYECPECRAFYRYGNVVIPHAEGCPNDDRQSQEVREWNTEETKQAYNGL